jgi:hypothetical protein
MAALVIGALAFGAMLTGGLGPGSTPTAAATASPKTAGAAPTWNTYFYPLKVGWTCQEDLSTGVTGIVTGCGPSPSLSQSPSASTTTPSA